MMRRVSLSPSNCASFATLWDANLRAQGFIEAAFGGRKSDLGQAGTVVRRPCRRKANACCSNASIASSGTKSPLRPNLHGSERTRGDVINAPQLLSCVVTCLAHIELGAPAIGLGHRVARYRPPKLKRHRTFAGVRKSKSINGGVPLDAAISPPRCRRTLLDP
jgi:hypothetical protein